MALGYASPSRMLTEMRPSELHEWFAFYRIDPWGEGRGDLRSGIVASVVANANRGRSGKTFTAMDFMPFAEREPDGQVELAKRIRAALRPYKQTTQRRK